MSMRFSCFISSKCAVARSTSPHCTQASRKQLKINGVSCTPLSLSLPKTAAAALKLRSLAWPLMSVACRCSSLEPPPWPEPERPVVQCSERRCASSDRPSLAAAFDNAPEREASGQQPRGSISASQKSQARSARSHATNVLQVLPRSLPLGVVPGARASSKAFSARSPSTTARQPSSSAIAKPSETVTAPGASSSAKRSRSPSVSAAAVNAPARTW
mmetsp:Transcript_60427/g.174344  ORF Transcript_60427/g.174344 Transcript_60427/m.174344 type:complete len:216 (+) Transcript_60427:1683-2330(+)